MPTKYNYDIAAVKQPILTTDCSELYKYFLDKDKADTLESVLEITETNHRSIYVTEITDATGLDIESVVRFFNRIDNELEIPIEDRIPIKIYINSNGGDLNSAFTACDAIKNSSTPVWTINIGKAYSGGALIFVCGDKRYSFKYSSVVFHEGAVSMGGDAHKFRNSAAFYEKQLNMLKNIILENTKITEEQYEEHKKDDWWLDSEECILYGVTDEVVTNESYKLF